MKLIELFEQTLGSLRGNYTPTREWRRIDSEWQGALADLDKFLRAGGHEDMYRLITGHGQHKLYGLQERLTGLAKKVQQDRENRIIFIISHTLASLWDLAGKRNLQQNEDFLFLFGQPSPLNLSERLSSFLELTDVEKHFTVAMAAFFINDLVETLESLGKLSDEYLQLLGGLRGFYQYTAPLLAQANLQVRDNSEQLGNTLAVTLTAGLVIVRQAIYLEDAVAGPVLPLLQQHDISLEPDFVYFGDVAIPTMDMENLPEEDFDFEEGESGEDAQH